MSTIQAARPRTRELRSHAVSPRVGETLGRYTDAQQGSREIVTFPGAHGSVLVIDRLAVNAGDAWLLAHLFPDEPPENARIVCELYLADERHGHCRALTPEDLQAPAGREPNREAQEIETDPQLVDRAGCSYQLTPSQNGSSMPELRWRRHSPGLAVAQAVTIRDVVGSLESYEPVREMTIDAIDAYANDTGVSVVALRAELGRLSASPIVLNRGLREAVLAAVQRGLSMSEIAIRCGRVKRDARGRQSGETSWLGRRIGVLAEAGRSAPTPWVSSEVLALIARRGLHVAPREVEL